MPSAPAASAPVLPAITPSPASLRLPVAEPIATQTADAPLPPKNLPAAEFTLSSLQKTELATPPLKIESPVAEPEVAPAPPEPKSAEPTLTADRLPASERAQITERGTTIDRNSALARLAKIVARP